MKNLEQMLYNTDFSRNTDLKARLAGKLFAGSPSQSDKVVSFPFSRLSDEDADLVNAAQGIRMDTDPEKK